MDDSIISARARLAAIVDSSHDAILAKDTNGIVTAWNPAAQRLYGYAPKEIIGRSIETIIPPEFAGECDRILAEVLAGRVVQPYDTERISKSGDRVAVSIAVSPIRDADGQVVGASTIARDISERRAAEAERAASKAREQALDRELAQSRRLESVGQLAGGIAHDFNNLLGVILNLALFLSDALPEGSPEREDADEIGLTATRAAALTRQLLIFSRRDVAKPEVLDLGEVTTGLASLLERALGEGIAMETASDAELRSVEMDRGQLEQVLVNLAVNARDAMPNGGRLVIEARNTTVDAEFAGSRVGLEIGEYVTLTVSDTGAGMDPDTVERAFEPFFTTKPEGHGTGLGLATVYGIVSKAGGRVALYSEPGRGTSVRVHLPATSLPAAVAGEPPAPAPLGQGERILVVEDAPDVRQIAERILVRAGYVVVTASSAAEGRAAIHGPEPFDLILTDVIMPGTTGTQMVDELRLTHPSLRVVFMSGYSHQLLTPDMLDLHVSAFIEKPFTAHQLCTTVRELLDTEGP